MSVGVRKSDVYTYVDSILLSRLSNQSSEDDLGENGSYSRENNLLRSKRLGVRWVAS